MRRKTGVPGLMPTFGEIARRAKGTVGLPTIAVLPFSSDNHQRLDPKYALGFTGHVAESLAKVPDLVVIAPASTLTYRLRKRSFRKLGADLQVRYFLAGNIRIESQSIVIDTWLGDAETDHHLWHETVKEPLAALHDAEHQIFARVVSTVAPHLRDVEIERARRKSMPSLTAHDCVLRAMWAMSALERSSFDYALQHLERAMTLDPAYAAPHALKARWHNIRIGQSWSDDREIDARAAGEHASRAIALDPRSSLALATAGHIKSYLQKDYKAGLALLNRSIAACYGDANAWSLSSATLSYLGDGAEARVRAEHAIRLSPYDPALYSYCFFAGLACYVEGDYARAIGHLKRSLAENAGYSSTYKVLCASFVGEGDVSAARVVAARLGRIEPHFVTTGAARSPFSDGAVTDRYFAQLRTAGAIDRAPSASPMS